MVVLSTIVLGRDALLIGNRFLFAFYRGTVQQRDYCLPPARRFQIHFEQRSGFRPLMLHFLFGPLSVCAFIRDHGLG